MCLHNFICTCSVPINAFVHVSASGRGPVHEVGVQEILVREVGCTRKLWVCGYGGVNVGCGMWL
jgi:hypothetical protein